MNNQISPVLRHALASTSGGATNYYEYRGGKPIKFNWFEREDLIFNQVYLLKLKTFFKKALTWSGGVSYNCTGWNKFWHNTGNGTYSKVISKLEWDTIESDFNTMRNMLQHVSQCSGKYFEFLVHVGLLKSGYEIHPNNVLPLKSGVTHTFDAVVNLTRNGGERKWAPVECSWRYKIGGGNQNSKFKEDFRRIQESPFERGLIITHGDEVSDETYRSLTWDGNVQYYSFEELNSVDWELPSKEEYASYMVDYRDQYSIRQTQLVSEFNRMFD